MKSEGVGGWGPGAGEHDVVDDVRAPGWAEAVEGPAAVVPVDEEDEGGLAPDEVSGNLRRYARWQWRDYWERRGFWTVGGALFGVWFLVQVALAERVGVGPGGAVIARPPGPEEAMGIPMALFAIGGALAAALGVGGLVARERERGLQRFLFAKPIGIVRYYLQGLGVNSVGSLLVILGAVLLAGATAGVAIPVLPVLAVAASAYALTAGVTFLLSTLVRFDAAIVLGWLLAGFPVVALANNNGWWRWWFEALQWLFPHGPALALMKAVVGANNLNALSPGAAAGYGAIVALVIGLAYGAAGVAAGVAVLRRRSISA